MFAKEQPHQQKRLVITNVFYFDLTQQWTRRCHSRHYMENFSFSTAYRISVVFASISQISIHSNDVNIYHHFKKSIRGSCVLNLINIINIGFKIEHLV